MVARARARGRGMDFGAKSGGGGGGEEEEEEGILGPRGTKGPWPPASAWCILIELLS